MNQKLAFKIYEGSLFITKLVLMNGLWLLFVFLGGIIFGIIPATITLAAVFRKAIILKEEFKWVNYAFKQYFRYLKKFFFVSLGYGIVQASLYLSYLTLGKQHFVLEIVISLMVYYINFVMFPFLAINEVHFQLSLRALLKNAALLPVFWGLTTVKVIAVIFAISALTFLVPGILPFFSFSVPIYLCTNIILTRWQKYLGKGDEEPCTNV